MRTKIEFINHASVILSGKDLSILTDSWFSGGSFNNGWKLLSETDISDAENILNLNDCEVRDHKKANKIFEQNLPVYSIAKI